MIAHAMFDHVTLRVADLEASARFYTTVLDTLGVPRLDNDIGPEWENDLSLARADAEHPVTRNLHLAFFAPAHDEVRGVLAGRASTPATRTTASPGPGPQYTPEYFGGFLRDPDGNSAEAVYLEHEPPSAARSTTCGSASRTSPPRATSTPRSRRTRGSA